jgi:Uma2 family endonuclease
MNKPAAIDSFREQPMRFTAEEFFELAALPPIADHVGKIELVDGVIVGMSPAENPHAVYHTRLLLRLAQAYGNERPGGWRPLVEISIKLGSLTVRDADIAIVKYREDPQGPALPEDVLLIVEIAHTSLDRDLGPKLRNYAAAGIAHYWVVDVGARRTHLFKAPKGEAYGSHIIVAFGDPLSVPQTDKTIVID